MSTKKSLTAGLLYWISIHKRGSESLATYLGNGRWWVHDSYCDSMLGMWWCPVPEDVRPVVVDLAVAA
jgi:hypothetical protein